MPEMQPSEKEAAREIAKALAVELLKRSGVQSLETPDETNRIAHRAVEMARIISEGF